MAIIRLSHLADVDLDTIRDFIARDSPAAANTMLEQLFDTLELLAANPEIGQRRDDLQPGARAHSMRPYVIVYHPADDGIHVIRVVHGARDYPSLFLTGKWISRQVCTFRIFRSGRLKNCSASSTSPAAECARLRLIAAIESDHSSSFTCRKSFASAGSSASRSSIIVVLERE
jgi:toxin ParE1/3/4